MQARLRLGAHMIVLITLIPVLTATPSQPKPHAKVVTLQKSDNGILPILTGPPETVTMKSGYVVLEPGRSVGKHSTEHHEELLIVLEGQGEMRFADDTKLELNAHTALYCPPETEHDVWNTGAGTLRYVYVIADAR